MEEIFALTLQEVNTDKIYDGIRARVAHVRSFTSRRRIQERMYLAPAELLQTGNILNKDGTPYEFPDDEDLFGEDISFAWLDNCYLKQNKDGSYRYHRVLKLDRVIVLDIMLQIDFPELASAYR